MDDAMTDLMAADAQLRRRLEAYAVARLSPDPTATARIRARVLATAHRQAALARADASLMVVPADATRAGAAAPRRPTTRTMHRPIPTLWRRAATIALAASLCLTVAVGGAFAAAPGGPLYGTRLWIETLTLPSDPSARAIAELERMDSRLREAAAANDAGDQTALAAALTAYEAIVDDASDQALRDDDEVASAALEAGVARNITVLTALATRLPEEGAAAVTRALERAIDRSDEAVHAIGSGGTGGGNDRHDDGNGHNGGGGAPGTQPTPTHGPASTHKPTPTPKATKAPKPTDEPAAKPTKAPTPEPTAKPTRTPRPARTPPAGAGQPSGPPGQGGSNGG
jgi:cell division septation protein DedD